MNYLLLIVLIATSCAGSEGMRHDSNSDKYKSRHGIHKSPAKTKSGPQSGCYYQK